MTTNIGQILTRADIAGLANVAQTVSGATGAAGAPGGGFGDLESVLKFIERVVPLIEQAGTTIMKMQSFEAAHPAQQVIESPPQPPPPQLPSQPSPNPQPEPAKAAPTISTMKVYSAALGALSDLSKMDPELSVAAALTMARDYKDMILPLIEEKLPELYNE